MRLSTPEERKELDTIRERQNRCPICNNLLDDSGYCDNCYYQKRKKLGAKMEKELTEKEKEQQTIEDARKVMNANTVDKLVTLANSLDTKGMTAEAAVIDHFLSEYYGPCTDCDK